MDCLHWCLHLFTHWLACSACNILFAHMDMIIKFCLGTIKTDAFDSVSANFYAYTHTHTLNMLKQDGKKLIQRILMWWTLASDNTISLTLRNETSAMYCEAHTVNWVVYMRMAMTFECIVLMLVSSFSKNLRLLLMCSLKTRENITIKREKETEWE